jgi:tripartite-type tricarboxylate transporter receptor subunit TctC
MPVSKKSRQKKSNPWSSKANPNKASAAIFSPGFHLLTALFQKQTGTQFTLVPHRGGAAATQDLVAGQIDLVPGGAPDQLLPVPVGSMKTYAVTSGARLARWHRNPDLCADGSAVGQQDFQ